MSINKILVLDRNVVSLIKDANSQKKQSSTEQVQMLRKLKTNDRKVTSITPMLSIIEGQKGRKESEEEMEETIHKEANALKVFFSKAKVDSNFLLQNAQTTSEIFVESDKEYMTKYDLFLEEINPIILDKPKKSDRENLKNTILDIAKKRGISAGHPVVICCLSALFGSGSSRRILKLKKDNYNPYNARSDLLVISRFNHIKAKAKSADKNIKVEYLTLDKDLDKFLSMITINNATMYFDVVEFSVAYNKKLFPDLTNKEYLQLKKDIEEKNLTKT